MKKNDALQMQSRLGQLASKATALDLQDDGKLYHHALDERAFWTQRLAVPHQWPHRGSCAEGVQPGLRLEVWYFQGRGTPNAQKGDSQSEIVWLLGLCAAHEALAELDDCLTDTWLHLLESGKYAKRYVSLDPFVKRIYPGCTGVMRTIAVEPNKRFEEGVAVFFQDLVPLLSSAAHKWDPDGHRREQFLSGAVDEDPFEKLRRNFGKK